MSFQYKKTWSFSIFTLSTPSPQAFKTICLGFMVLCTCFILSLTLGHYGLSFERLMMAFTNQGTPFEQWVLWSSRLPRALTAIGVGAALGLSGAVFQTITKNPLGSPDLIGINASASAGALLWLSFMSEQEAWIGACLGTLTLIIFLGFQMRHTSYTSHHLIVLGIVVNAFCVALVQFMLSLVRREEALQLLSYLNGSLAYKDWSDVALIMSLLVLVLPCFFALSKRVSLISHDIETVQALGVSVRKTYGLLFFLATLLAIVSVLIVGPVSFIALIAPHLARFGSSQTALMRSAVLGALLLLMADTLSLVIPSPQRIPIGILTALLGGLYLFLLLLKQRNATHQN
tara:strand:- start:6480 stop:7514 length:1035 start_codon:yes stop_codon:yes gene_type:complete